MKPMHYLAATTALTCSISAPALAQDDTVTLTFYHSHLAYMEPILEGFMESHPNIVIDQQAPAENYNAGDQSVIRGIMTNSAPDVYLPSYASIPTIAGTLAERGRDVSLEPLLAEEGEDWVEANYAESVLELGQIDGAQYAMPFNASLPLVYVNADLVEQAGGDIDDFPTTWDGIIELANDINALGDDVSGLTFSVGGLSGDWYWQMMVLSAGGEMLNEDMTGIGYDNEAGMMALQATQDMAVKTDMEIYATPTPGQQKFFAGKLGMVIESPSELVAYEKAIGDRFDLSTERFPLIVEDGGLPAGGNALMILTDDAEKRAAAWEFVKYMTSGETQAEVSKASGYMPTNKQAAEALADFYEANPNFQTVFDSMDAAAPWFAYPNNTAPDIWKGVAPVIDQLQRGKVTPEEAMPKLREHVASVLANQ